MELGDILSLVFVGIIVLSFLSRFVGREDVAEGPPVRPTELSQSGGNDPRRTAMESRDAGRQDGASTQRPPTPQPASMFPTTNGIPEPIRDRREEVVRDRSEEALRNRAEEALRDRSEEARRNRSEELLRDRSEELTGEQRSRPVRQVESRRSGGQQARARRGSAGSTDTLRRTLRNRDAVKRAFVIKELLDPPVGMRRDT